MAGLLTPVKPVAPASEPPAPPPPGGGGFGGEGGSPEETAGAVRRYKTGTWLALAAVVMVFAAFSSAYVVRKGLSNDWRPIRIPAVLWLNTAVLLASSATLERARRGDLGRWLSVTAALGAAFLGGQVLAWRQLSSAGVYLATNPSSSFFYLLTGAHGLHLLGGVLALFYVAFRAWRSALWVRRQAAVEATTLYWHFMDGLWIYVFLLLLLGR